MRGQRSSRHVKNCWRRFLQTRDSRRRFQVAIASKIYPVFAALTKNTRGTPPQYCHSQNGKAAGVHPSSAIIPPQTLPRRFHGSVKQAS